MPAIDKQLVLDLLQTQKSDLNEEFDKPETTDERKHEINGGLTTVFLMRQEVNKLPDLILKKEE